MNLKPEVMIQTVPAVGIRCLGQKHKKWITKHCYILQITCLMLPKDGSRQGACVGELVSEPERAAHL